MLLSLLLYALLSVLLFVLKELVITAIRNREAHKFFEKYSPNLPLAPNLGIFGGHINNLVWGKRNWKTLGDIHEQYGKTVGVFYCDKPMVSTIDLDLVKAIVLDNPNDHVNRMTGNTPVEELEKDCIFFCDDDQWRRIRRAIAPAFTRCKIQKPNVQSEIIGVIERLIESLENKLDDAKLERGDTSIKMDADDLFFRYASALILSCFYKQDKIVDFDAKTDRFTQIIDRSIKTCVNPVFKFCIMFPAFTPIINWLMLRFHPVGIMRREILAFIKQQTLLNLKAKQQIAKARQIYEANKQSGGEKFDADNFLLSDGTKFRRNMIDFVIDQFHDGKLTQSEYMNSTFILFLAAVKTSADALSKLIYQLATHQEEQEKLRASILKEGADSEYLLWTINESMRLLPPGTAGIMRRVSYDLKTKDGLTIPANTLVYTHPNVIHRLPEYWGPSADEFRPERWRNASSFHPLQFIPFGAGKRNCPGGQFAMIEMKMLMNELLRRYRFKCSPDTNAKTIMEFDTFIIFTSSDIPVNIEISRV